MATGELENKFSLIPYRDCTFFTNFFKKTLQFSIYSDISLYKKGTFHHKKGHF
jgi:hypothetical protein